MKCRAIAILAFFTLLDPFPSWAQGVATEKLEDLSSMALELYKAQRYGEARQAWFGTLQAVKDPTARLNLYYNLARASEKLEDFHSAKNYYDQYLQQTKKRAKIDPAKVEVVEERVHWLTLLLRRESSSQTPFARKMGWGVLGVGAASTALGVVFAVMAGLAQSDISDIESDLMQSTLDFEGAKDTLNWSTPAASVALGVGATAVVTGLLLVLLGDDQAGAKALQGTPKTPYALTIGL